MDKKRLILLNGHFSTGGSCMYILKLAESFKDKYEIHIIEHSYAGPDFVVHRKEAERLYNFHSCYGDSNALIPIINSIQPFAIHIHELPETFLPDNVLSKLYANDRYYNIIVTSHSSLSRKKDFWYMPDKIVAVNKWQQNLFKEEFTEIPVGIWEYPIEDKKTTPEQKEKARQILNAQGLFPLGKAGTSGYYDVKKHILNIGLWTPGKNQGELFEIARNDRESYYHFVGNNAPNFREYWQPIWITKPGNCILWGERDDVELFYQAADEFYFTSKFELNPLVIREALSYGLPVKMRRLPSYGTDYDNNPLVTYIN